MIAIAAATLLKEECRTQAIEAKVLPHVISGLGSKQPNVRLAACQCAKSLSRSVSHLRTSLVDAGVAPPLIKVTSLFNREYIIKTNFTSSYSMTSPWWFKQLLVVHSVILYSNSLP